MPHKSHRCPFFTSQPSRQAMFYISSANKEPSLFKYRSIGQIRLSKPLLPWARAADRGWRTLLLQISPKNYGVGTGYDMKNELGWGQMVVYICSSAMESCQHFLRMFHCSEGEIGVVTALKTHSPTQQVNEQGDEKAGLSKTAESSPSQITDHHSSSSSASLHFC